MDTRAKHARQDRPGVRSGGGKVRSGKKSQRRWREILSAATELFTEKGFYASSMQDISEKVGIRKASLYYYVDTKEQLLYEILKDLHHGGVALVEAIDFESSNPLGELRSLLVHMGIYAGRHADRLEIFARDFDYLDGEQQKQIISERRLYREAVRKLIERAIAIGDAADTLDDNVASQAVVRAVASISQWYRPGGSLQIERVAVQTAGLLVQGLKHYDRG